VGQVLVHRPGLGLGGGHGNALLGGVGEEVVATGEAVVESRVTPGGNDLDIGLEGVEGKLETDLVVTLAGATVGNSEASFPLGDLDLSTSNDGTGQRSSQKVDVLVDSVAGNGGEAELLNELPYIALDTIVNTKANLSSRHTAEVGNLALDGTELQGLLPDSVKVLFLANIGSESNNFVALVNEPFQDDTGVETTAEGDADLSFRHG
jgi:hypothetical protein